MTRPAGATSKATWSDSLAAERTYLAWIRTGLALMGFGFVVARFGLFLKQLELIQHAQAKPSYGAVRVVRDRAYHCGSDD